MAIKQWLTGVGDWNNASLWSGGVPASGDIAIIPGGSSSIIRGQSLDGISVLLTRDGTQTTDLTLQGAVLGSTSSIVGYETGGPVSVTLANSVVDGIIGSALGQTNITIAQNYGAILGALSVSGAQGTASEFVDANYGQLYNFGTIYAENKGTIVVSYGKAQVPPPGHDPTILLGPQQVVTNAGLVEATSRGQVYFQGDYGGAKPGTINTGILANSGTIDANGGIVTIASDLTQGGPGIIKVENNGTLILGGKADGGTVEITSGSLYWGGEVAGQRYFNGRVSSGQFHSNLLLDGASGKASATLDFGAKDVSFAFDQAKQDLTVFAPQSFAQTNQIADIHVARGGGILPSDFAAHGSSIVFTAHA